MHLKLIPDPFLILVNNLKQPLHARNSFINQILWNRIYKKLKKEFKKSQLHFPFEPHVIGMSLVCHSCVTRMYSYVISISLVCTRMSFVCHPTVVLPWPVVIHGMWRQVYLMTEPSKQKARTKTCHVNDKQL